MSEDPETLRVNRPRQLKTAATALEQWPYARRLACLAAEADRAHRAWSSVVEDVLRDVAEDLLSDRRPRIDALLERSPELRRLLGAAVAAQRRDSVESGDLVVRARPTADVWHADAGWSGLNCEPDLATECAHIRHAAEVAARELTTPLSSASEPETVTARSSPQSRVTPRR